MVRLGLDSHVWEVKDGGVISLKCISEQDLAQLANFHFRGVFPDRVLLLPFFTGFLLTLIIFSC
jgi:hypothetical protein